MRTDELCAGGPSVTGGPTADRIRVLLVSPMLTGGGAERFTSTLLNHLDRNRFAPEVCLLVRNVSYPLADDIPIHALDHAGPRTLWRSVRRLRALIERLRPDIVMSNLAYTSLFVGGALRRCSLAPRWIARVGAPPDLENKGLVRLLVTWWLRRVYPLTAEIVPNSQRLAERVISYYGIAPNRVQVIGNPTDFALMDRLAAEQPCCTADPEVPVVLSVGRLEKQKRLDLLLDAFADVRRRRVAELWICGDGPLHSQLGRRVAELGMAQHVKFLGFCANPYALMRQASLFVLTSDFEGLPNALIEAQGLGVPAVSTACPTGPDEIIEHNRTGLLVIVGDTTALACGIEELLSDRTRLQEMGQAARLRARKLFDAPAVVRQWESLLSKCCASANR